MTPSQQQLSQNGWLAMQLFSVFQHLSTNSQHLACLQKWGKDLSDLKTVFHPNGYDALQLAFFTDDILRKFKW